MALSPGLTSLRSNSGTVLLINLEFSGPLSYEKKPPPPPRTNKIQKELVGPPALIGFVALSVDYGSLSGLAL